MQKHMARLLLLLAVLFLPALAAADQKYTNTRGLELDVPFVPTSYRTVERMLRMGKAGPNDVHYDLGSGDGRIVIAAVRDYKVKKGIGVDIDPKRIEEAVENAKHAGVSDRVKFIKGDIFQMDFSEATLITMYLLPEVNMKLRPKILDMKPGTRIVSHAFDMDDWRPDQHEVVDISSVFMWTVPAKVAGQWMWEMDGRAYRLNLAQTFQVASGTLGVGKDTAILADVALDGPRLRFEARFLSQPSIPPLLFVAQVNGDAMAATVKSGSKSQKINVVRASTNTAAKMTKE